MIIKIKNFGSDTEGNINSFSLEISLSDIDHIKLIISIDQMLELSRQLDELKTLHNLKSYKQDD
jgi:hypothetical protein